jgi:hypothetical protein
MSEIRNDSTNINNILCDLKSGFDSNKENISNLQKDSNSRKNNIDNEQFIFENTKIDIELLHMES